jgi:hypothetical protein
MASPCGSLVSTWYHPPRRSSHPFSSISSAAKWTNCGQPRLHSIHPRLHSSTRTFGTRPTRSCGKALFAAPWNHHTKGRMKSLHAQKKHSKLSCVADKSQYPQTKLNQLTFCEEISKTGSPPAYLRSTPAKTVTPPSPPQALRTTRSVRTVRFPECFTIWARVSAGVWCVNTHIPHNASPFLSLHIRQPPILIVALSPCVSLYGPFQVHSARLPFSKPSSSLQHSTPDERLIINKPRLQYSASWPIADQHSSMNSV